MSWEAKRCRYWDIFCRISLRILFWGAYFSWKMVCSRWYLTMRWVSYLCQRYYRKWAHTVDRWYECQRVLWSIWQSSTSTLYCLWYIQGSTISNGLCLSGVSSCCSDCFTAFYPSHSWWSCEEGYRETWAHTSCGTWYVQANSSQWRGTQYSAPSRDDSNIHRSPGNTLSFTSIL